MYGGCRVAKERGWLLLDRYGLMHSLYTAWVLNPAEFGNGASDRFVYLLACLLEVVSARHRPPPSRSTHMRIAIVVHSDSLFMDGDGLHPQWWAQREMMKALLQLLHDKFESEGH